MGTKAKCESVSGVAREARLMTPAQEFELKRLTPFMWEVLREVERLGPGGYSLTPKRTLEILSRRGFIEMAPRPDADGYYSARLTEAGVEALERLRERRGA